MLIDVWTLPDCVRCKEVSSALERKKLAYNEKSIVALRAGDIMDVDALAEFAMCGGIAPMVSVRDAADDTPRFLSEAEIRELLQ